MKTSDVQLDSPDKPPLLFIATIVVSTFLFVFAFWFIANAALSKFTNYKQSKIETGMGNKVRLSYIEKETQYLNSTTKSKDGTRKLSIEEAMAKVIEKENK